MISLVMRTAEGDERVFPVRDRVVIGRNSRCQVRIALPIVCDHHCELTIVNGEVHLTDLGSQSGTFHNGRRVKSAKLVDADMLTVGPVTFELRVGSPAKLEKPAVLKPVQDVLKKVAEAAEVPEITVISRKGIAAKPAES